MDNHYFLLNFVSVIPNSKYLILIKSVCTVFYHIELCTLFFIIQTSIYLIYAVSCCKRNCNGQLSGWNKRGFGIDKF